MFRSKAVFQIINLDVETVIINQAYSYRFYIFKETLFLPHLIKNSELSIFHCFVAFILQKPYPHLLRTEYLQYFSASANTYYRGKNRCTSEILSFEKQTQVARPQLHSTSCHIIHMLLLVRTLRCSVASLRHIVLDELNKTCYQ